MKKESNHYKNKKKWYLLIPVVIIVLGSMGFYMTNQGYESTNNAQLDGNIITLRSSVGSYVDAIYFEDNQQVQKGDTLMKLNTTKLEANVFQAQAALEEAKAKVQVMDKSAEASFEDANASRQMVSSNEQEIKIAQARYDRAKLEYERSVKLLEIQGITQQQFEQSQNQMQIAKADLEQAMVNKASASSAARGKKAIANSQEAEISTGHALVERRKAELALAIYDLEHAYITAPCDGLVTKRSVQLGNYVSVGQNLCAVIDRQHLWVSANVKETQLDKIKVGQEVTVEVDAYPDIVLSGKVASFGGATGAKFSLIPPDNATGNFVKVVQRVPIRISLEAFEVSEVSQQLFPGLSTTVSIKTR